MADVVRSVIVRVRGDISGLESAYKRGGTATDEFANKLERAGENSRIVSEHQKELGTQLRSNNRALGTYNKHLDKMGSSSSTTGSKVRRLSTETQVLERRTQSLGAVSTKSSNQIDRLSGRIALAAEAAVTLGPGLLAGGVVPLAGLAAQATAAGIGLGVLIGSFQGVKAAVTALGKADLDPTIANLQAADQAMAGLSPAARRMARDITSRAVPALKVLRNEGSQSMFPGLIAGTDQLGTRLPETRKLVREVGLEIGTLGRDAGKSLSGSDWDKAFNYAIRTTPGLLDDIGRSLGNLGLAGINTIAALDPLTQDWSGGLLDFTQKLADGSANLEDNKGFQDFLAYAHEMGPDVLHTLGQLAGMLISIGKAGAPISGPLIKTLGVLASIVGDIADSDIGTPLVAGAIAMTAYGKATDLAARAQARLGIASKTTVTGGGATILGGPSAIGKARGSLKALTSDLRVYRSVENSAQGRARASVGALDAQSAAAGRLRTRVGQLGKGAAVLGGVAILASGAADGIGLTNTASLALMGTMLGPWGAAIGAGAGALLDIKAAGKGAADTFHELDQAAKTTDLGRISNALSRAKSSYKDSTTTSGVGDALSDAGRLYGGLLQGHSPGGDDTKIAKTQRQFSELKLSYKGLARTIGQPLPDNASVKQIIDFADKAEPALKHLGLTGADFFDQTNEQRAKTAQGVKDYLTRTDTMRVRTQGVADSIKQIGTDAILAADGASQLATSLTSLLSPGLNAEASADNLAASYEKMQQTLKKGRGAGFTKDTAGGRDNRAATRDVVTGIEERLSAAAANGAGSQKLAGILKDSREKFIQEGKAAGFSTAAIRKRANELGLTPRLVRTVLEAVGEGESSAAIHRFAKGIRALPKSVQSEIKANGVPRTVAQIDALARKYHLTPKQVRTLASLKDQSSVVIAKVMRLLARLGKQHPTPKVKVDTGASLGAIGAVAAGLGRLHDKTITVTVHGARTGASAAALAGVGARGLWLPARRFADGGMDIPDRHQPEMAAGGTIPRVWAERETMGESYIPHANDDRRPRAKSILEQTAGLMGGNVTWNAAGSITRSGTNTLHVGGYDIIVPDKAALAFAQGMAAAAAQQAKSAKDIRAEHLADLQAQQSIRDINRELDAMAGKKHHRHLALRGLDRREKRAELAAAKDELYDLRHEAATTLAETRKEAITTLSGAGDIFARGTGASSAVSSINRTVADIGQFGQVVAQLKAAGASPALLQQVIAKGNEGDFRSAIRLGKALLASPATLKQLNASLASLASVSGSVGSLTTDPRLLSSSAWNPTGVAPKVVNVAVTTDPSTWAVLIRQAVRHEVEAAMRGIS